MKIHIFAKLMNSLIEVFYHSPAHSILLQNAALGNISSQCNLAEFYFTEMKDYIEAYAWADVACFGRHPDAYVIKNKAQEMLKPDQIRKAWDRARKYRLGLG